MFVAYDLDGVIADSYTAFRARCIAKLDYDPLLSHDQYKITIPGLSDQEMHDLYMEVFAEGDLVMPFPDYLFLLKALQDNKIERLLVLTARPKEYAKQTERWLWSVDLLSPLSDRCFFIQTRSSKKADILRDHSPAYFVEDRARTASQVADAGIKSYLVNRHWNINRPVHPKVIRVDSIQQIIMEEHL